MLGVMFSAIFITVFTKSSSSSIIIQWGWGLYKQELLGTFHHINIKSKQQSSTTQHNTSSTDAQERPTTQIKSNQDANVTEENALAANAHPAARHHRHKPQD
jgi:hypothetical protein